MHALSSDCIAVFILLAPRMLVIVGIMDAERLLLLEGDCSWPAIAAEFFGELGREAAVDARIRGSLLETFRCWADGQGAALKDALDIIAVHFEIGDGIQASEFYGSDVIGLCCFFLGGCRV